MLPPTVTQLQARFSGVAIKALVIIAAMVAAFAYGQHVRQAEIDAAERNTALAYAGEIVRLQDHAAVLLADLEAARASRASATQTITREVIRYASRPDHCQLPGAFRLLHDAAATGQAALAAAESVDAASAEPVADAAVLETVASNYAACREDAARLTAWQQRYHALEAPR